MQDDDDDDHDFASLDLRSVDVATTVVDVDYSDCIHYYYDQV